MAAPGLLRRTDRAGLAAQVGATLAVVLASNGAIFAVGGTDDVEPSPLLPPGPVVGSVWVVLFAGMATARWLLLGGRHREDALRALWTLGLLCLVYPLYSGLLRGSRVPGLVGSALTTAAAGRALRVVARRSAPAALPVAATLAWLGYATVAQADTLRRRTPAAAG